MNSRKIKCMLWKKKKGDLVTDSGFEFQLYNLFAL